MSKRVAVTHSNEIKVRPYLEALRAAGADPVAIDPATPAAMSEFAGLVLAGGIDVNPRLYGQERHPESDEPNDARDALELRLLNEALARDLPVLAICRGMQLFNVARGGTLAQHIAATSMHRVYPEDRGTPAHEITVSEGSRLASILGTTHVQVNSRHHQAVDQSGNGLIVTSRAPDNLIESLELPEARFAIGVQWHPEDQTRDPIQRRLFQHFHQSLP